MEWYDIPKIERWGKSFTIPWNSLEQQLVIYEREVGLDLDPDFQRGHVWSQQQQIKYVEYVLRGGNLNRHIIFNCPGFLRAILNHQWCYLMVNKDSKLRGCLLSTNFQSLMGCIEKISLFKVDRPRRYPRF